MSRLRSRLTAGTVTGALTVAGLGAVAPAPSAAAVARPATTVYASVTASSAIRMASRVHPGTHRFVVSAAESATFQILRPARGYTKAEAARDANAGFAHSRPAAIRRFERNVTLVAGVPAARGRPGVMWAHLSRGAYWALDIAPTVTRAANIRTFRVAGAAQTSTAPRARSVVRAVGVNDWAPSPTVIRRSGVLSFRNDSRDNHFVALVKLQPGKTVADFKAWVDALNRGTDAGEPPLGAAGLSSGVVGPGRAMSMRYSAPAGDYVMACWWQDADRGAMPHVFMGMYRGVTLR